jgi:hypothetical protein
MPGRPRRRALRHRALLFETDGFRSRIAAEVPADTVAGLGVSARRTRADRLGLAAAREASRRGPARRASAASPMAGMRGRDLVLEAGA